MDDRSKSLLVEAFRDMEGELLARSKRTGVEDDPNEERWTGHRERLAMAADILEDHREPGDGDVAIGASSPPLADVQHMLADAAAKVLVGDADWFPCLVEATSLIGRGFPVLLHAEKLGEPLDGLRVDRADIERGGKLADDMGMHAVIDEAWVVVAAIDDGGLDEVTLGLFVGKAAAIAHRQGDYFLRRVAAAAWAMRHFPASDLLHLLVKNRERGASDE